MLIILLATFAFAKILLSEQMIIDKRFVPSAQTASITGNWALWHNPAGLAFLGGGETSALYLYEWSQKGNRHHGGVNLAFNLWRFLSLAGGINTQAAFADLPKRQLGTDLSGNFGLGLRLSENSGFGISFLKSHSFLRKRSTPTLISFGLQARPWSFLSMGGHYDEVDGTFFAAPNITAGISLRPFKEYLTIGLDGKWVARGKFWGDGFRFDPIFGLKTSFHGYQASVSTEIPDIKAGWKRPIFSVALDFNLAHLGLGFSGYINPHSNNYGFGSTLRTSSEEWPSIVERSGLWVELSIDSDGTLEQKPPSLAQRFFGTFESPLSVLALLRRIEEDQKIAGVVLNINGFAFGDARTQEWRNAIVSLRNAKKTVVVYLDMPSERDYYIASAANKIMMNKQATISFRHFQATLVYFGDLLEKIGIKADAVAAGSYKTAPRQWTNARPQKEEIEIANNILTNFYETVISDVAKARNIDPDKLKVLFDRGEITADDAKTNGLVDEIILPDHAVDVLRDGGKVNLPIFSGYEHRKIKQEAFHAPKKIAVIPIANAIVDGYALPGLFASFFPVSGAKDIVDEIQDAQDDPNVLGIIVRIDSPGGDALAGGRINQALMDARKIKPVVTSMSDVAASAGYLVAAGTNHILALPNTITGSIGVFSLMFSGEKLAQKIGIFGEELSPIKNPGPTVLRTITESERQEAQRVTDWVYQNFINSVSDGLAMDKAEVLKNADGRVWLGHEALERKLIHEIGGFSQAIDRVRLLAEIAKDEPVSVEIRMPGQIDQLSFSAKLVSLFKNHSMEKDIKRVAKLIEPYLSIIEAYRLNGSPQARLPFDIEWQRRQGH